MHSRGAVCCGKRSQPAPASARSPSAAPARSASWRRALAADQPPIGTWPAGSQGTSVTIGAAVPRTGTYAVQGEDELKGMQLAVEHINERPSR